MMDELLALRQQLKQLQQECSKWKRESLYNVIRGKYPMYPLDVLLVGATGVGKSSTINALFGDTVAKVGEGVDPETMLTQSYEVNDIFRIWDSPGLGDGVSADYSHKKQLVDVLYKTYTVDDELYDFIDLVLVILDASSRDLGTTYQLLEQVIVKNIDHSRILVALNQADMAMKGRHWNNGNPSEKLIAFLEDKAQFIQQRIYENTGVKIDLPVYYSAVENWRVDELLEFIADRTPEERRNLPI